MPTFNPFGSLMEVDRYIAADKQKRRQLGMQERQAAGQQETRGLQNALLNIQTTEAGVPGQFRRDLTESGGLTPGLMNQFPVRGPAHAKALAGLQPRKTASAGQPVAVVGEGGAPVYVSKEDAIGKTPYYKPATGAGGIQGGLTPAQKKVDETFAKGYAEFAAAGGMNDVKKSVRQLKEARTELKTSGSITGGFIGALPDFLTARIFPEAMGVKDSVEEVVQRNLRLVLGAQFTEKEGARLIARAYNENLDEKENIKRLDRLIGQIEGAAKAKARAGIYYEKHGTLKGWKGDLPTYEDFGITQDQGPTASGASGGWDGPAGNGGIKFLGFE